MWCATAPSAPRSPRVSPGSPHGALRWLEAQSIEHDGEVIVRRVIGADGRSRAYVNGQLVPIQALREFAELLIEIHGQQEFQHLVKRSAQRELLDEHLARCTAHGASVAQVYERYRACRREYESLKSRRREPRGAARSAALSADRAQGRSDHGRRDRGAVRGTKAHRRPRPAGGRRRAARSPRCTRTTAPTRTICWRKAAAALRSAADMDPEARAGGAARVGGRRSTRARPPRRCGIISMRSMWTRNARSRSSGTPRRSRRSRASTARACSSCPRNWRARSRRSRLWRTPQLSLAKLEAALEELDARVRRGGTAPDAGAQTRGRSAGGADHRAHAGARHGAADALR